MRPICDFIAFHANGAPATVDGHVRMGIATHLRTIDAGLATVASYPELKKTPIVIGESDPEGCAACQGPQLDTVLADGVRGAPDVSALASLAGRRLAVMVWHYHDDDVPGPDAAVTLDVSGLPVAKGAMRLSHYRIDEMHSNAYAGWKRMGSPVAPTREQHAQLEAEGRLALLEPPSGIVVAGGMSTVKFTLPRQGVSLLVFG